MDTQILRHLDRHWDRHADVQTDEGTDRLITTYPQTLILQGYNKEMKKRKHFIAEVENFDKGHNPGM